jgi:hypothetical protein
MKLSIKSLTNESEAKLNLSTGLFDVASKFGNLTTKHLASAGISSSDCNSKGEFKFLKLVTTFKEILTVSRHHFASRSGVG